MPAVTLAVQLPREPPPVAWIWAILAVRVGMPLPKLTVVLTMVEL